MSGIHEYYVHYIELLSGDFSWGELALVLHHLSIEGLCWYEGLKCVYECGYECFRYCISN